MTGAKILIVEDEGIVALDIKKRLEILGYKVCGTVPSGEEAVDQASDMRPDLVLMDIRLKGDMDGLEAAEKIYTRFDIPVVYLTALADNGAVERAKMTEQFGYLIKPFEEQELYITIEIALHRHKTESNLRKCKQWLTAILRSMGDAVVVTDTTGHIVFVNPMAEKLTGWGQEDVLGKNVQRLFSGKGKEQTPATKTSAGKAPQGGLANTLVHHTLLVTRDGTEMPIDDNTAPIKDEEGNITGVVCIFRQTPGCGNISATQRKTTA